MRSLVLLALIGSLGCATGTATGRPTLPPDAAPQMLQALLAEHWAAYLDYAPDTATFVGVPGHDDRWPEVGEPAEAAWTERLRGFLARFEALTEAGLNEQEALTRTLMIRGLRLALEEASLAIWKMPADQMGGPHLLPIQLEGVQPFRTVEDYRRWVERLRRLPRYLDQSIQVMRLGLAAGLVPPRFVVDQVGSKAAEVAAASPEASGLAGCLERFPAEIGAGDRARLRDEVVSAIRDAVQPTYARFARFVREEYAPRARTTAGLWDLPGGAARYDYEIRRWTTTTLGAEEIHALGLREVARIEGEMEALARRAGHADLAGLRAALAADPGLRPSSREQVLELYRGYLAGIEPELPRILGRLPRARLVVEAVPPAAEAGATGAMYRLPALDGTQPGKVLVNTGHLEAMRTTTFESTAYHEGVPGHHLQLALQQELGDLPVQRTRWLPAPAYVEGWALYAERLALELGRFKEPASAYGHLEAEMMRAIRLVVDTGLHAKRWTREQVVDYFHAHSTLNEPAVQRETDRYVSWPGQALAYKIGQLHLLALRQRARDALGPAFDLRDFHDQILAAGKLPLDVLDARVERWIASVPRRQER